jgi:hypothetical protein
MEPSEYSDSGLTGIAIDCRHQATVAAGTLFDKTRTGLRVWFAAIEHNHLMPFIKTSISPGSPIHGDSSAGHLGKGGRKAEKTGDLMSMGLKRYHICP